MPGGGRGTLLDIAESLNSPKHTKIAKAIKNWIDGDYRVIASASIVGAAYDKCNHTKDLTDVWCHALDKGKVDPLEY